MAPESNDRRGPGRGGTGGGDSIEPEGFPIVGIGASAGGLEAFTELLRHLPLDTGMGFVLVQHLDPTRQSALTELLAKATSLPVREVTNSLRVRPNHVYIIPPNTDLGIAKGVLKLSPRTQTAGAHRSVDFFFESLAQDQHERAIGVVLSGVASDGTLGLEAIKAEGGITFAQDESARYDSMPRSAVAAGCVDFVFPPETIARELAQIARHPRVMRPAKPAPGPGEGGDARPASPRQRPARIPAGTGPAGAGVARGVGEGDGFKAVLLLLRNHTGVDFSRYKSSTIERRMTRRMVLNRSETVEDYAKSLRGNAKELNALYSDLLISVTGFFRNPEAFEFLQRKVFPRILPERRDNPVRIWVPGCSSGQEAYSLAMAFMEFSSHIPRAPKLQVFASDLNEALLDRARAGLYDKALTQGLSAERLRRFFTEEDGGYRVCKPLRQAVTFARHNLFSDPPFSRMDLISCRNLLIYVEESMQMRLIPLFHFALKPAGCLFLGAAEGIGGFTDLFGPLDKKHRLFFRKPGPSPALRERIAPAPATADREGAQSKAQGAPGSHAGGDVQREADRIALNRYAPTGVLVDADLRVLQFRGDASPYLRPPTGPAKFNLLKMACEGLMLPLRAALNKARKEGKVLRKEKVRVRQHGRSRSVNFEVVPLKNVKELHYLIFFEEANKAGEPARPREGPRTVRSAAKEGSRRIRELEAELAETRDYLESLQEQQEAAHEELQASNEEVTSANEELQSINEELETSKEELESANEELTTVNEEMTSRNAELSLLNSDLINLLTSSDLAILLLGRDLTIRRFSAQAGMRFDLQASDIGRPIGSMRGHLVFSEPKVDGNGAPGAPEGASKGLESQYDLATFVTEVIGAGRERECEVRDREGRWYSLRARPYLTLEKKVDGAVLVLVDIDALKRTEQAIVVARDNAANIVETVREPLLVLDERLRVESANRSFYRKFGVGPAETVGRSIFELGNREWDIPRLHALLEEVLPKHRTIEDFEVERDFGHLGLRKLVISARRVDDPSWKTHRILLAIEDVTGRE